MTESRDFLPTTPWRSSYMITDTRTQGEIGFHKNGTALDVWLRIDGRPRWFAVEIDALKGFLASDDDGTVLRCESDGNAE